MTECQGCGAWNNTSRTHCVLCGTSLAETDEWDAAAELPPLPPLPDGGLRSSMPFWLRESPELSVAESFPATGIAAPPRVEDAVPLGPRADPRTFLTDEDFPQWLRDLAARRDKEVDRAAESNDSSHAGAAAMQGVAPSLWPDWPGSVAPTIASTNTDTQPISEGQDTAQPSAEPASTLEPTSYPEPEAGADQRPPAALVAARALEESRGRNVWETLLLIFLFIGVIVAALWALASNGVFSPGL